MLLLLFTYVVWILSLDSVLAGPSPSNIVGLASNAPGATYSRTIRALGRSLSSVDIHERSTLYTNTTHLSKSWENAVIYADGESVNPELPFTTRKNIYLTSPILYYSSVSSNTSAGKVNTNIGVSILCQTCYIKSDIVATLAIN